jgi:hypothetical protein
VLLSQQLKDLSTKTCDIKFLVCEQKDVQLCPSVHCSPLSLSEIDTASSVWDQFGLSKCVAQHDVILLRGLRGCLVPSVTSLPSINQSIHQSIHPSIHPSNSTPLSDQFCLSNFTAATSRRSLVTDFTALMIHRMAASSIRSAGHGIRRRYLVVARGSCRDFATALMMINNRIATSSSRSTGHGIRTRVQTWGNCPAVELWSKLQHYSPGWE